MSKWDNQGIKTKPWHVIFRKKARRGCFKKFSELLSAETLFFFFFWKQGCPYWRITGKISNLCLWSYRWIVYLNPKSQRTQIMMANFQHFPTCNQFYYHQEDKKKLKVGQNLLWVVVISTSKVVYSCSWITVYLPICEKTWVTNRLNRILKLSSICMKLVNKRPCVGLILINSNKSMYVIALKNWLLFYNFRFFTHGRRRDQ